MRGFCPDVKNVDELITMLNDGRWDTVYLDLLTDSELLVLYNHLRLIDVTTDNAQYINMLHEVESENESRYCKDDLAEQIHHQEAGRQEAREASDGDYENLVKPF